jgi:hypothetical protein
MRRTRFFARAQSRTSGGDTCVYRKTTVTDDFTNNALQRSLDVVCALHAVESGDPRLYLVRFAGPLRASWGIRVVVQGLDFPADLDRPQRVRVVHWRYLEAGQALGPVNIDVRAVPRAQLLQYVKICSLYGAGFYYIPGTDTCIKIGGFVRAEMNFNAGNSFSLQTGDHHARGYNFEHSRARFVATFDTRSQTEYGTLRSYFTIGQQVSDNHGGSGVAGYANRGFIQWAGFTAGLADSFFDFFSFAGYSNQTNVLTSDIGGAGTLLFAYTAQFGNGLSATISTEDTTARRTTLFNVGGYAGRQYPDVVGNLRVDQAWGSAQIMGAIHQNRGLNFGDQVGWAVGGGLKLNLPWGHGDNVAMQAAYAKGALNYVGNGFTNFNVSNNGTNFAFSNVYDAVGTGNTLQLTEGWSVGAGAVHHWNPMWQTSLYGGYGAIKYGGAAAAVLNGGGGGNPNWNFSQVGSRTVWTPVKNLALSVDVLYNHVGTATAQAGANVAGSNVGWVSGIFRVQRNFWP